MKALIDELRNQHTLSKQQLLRLLSAGSTDDFAYLHAQARAVSERVFHKEIYIRGLIEISNYCRNDCFYCGIRKSNHNIERYRLHKEMIMACCHQAYTLGFRTFVLQGGEDLYYDDTRMCDIIATIRNTYPDCAITLSLGEKRKATYQAYYEAGANRYLLRYETSDELHYHHLHPQDMSLSQRLQCLRDLKAIGFQTGSGIMVGSPQQSIAMLVEDIKLMETLQPEMIGIGPYLPHHDTPFKDEAKGSLEMTLVLLSIFRLMFPHVLLPATTALASIDPNGRERGILAGANVVMPNISPPNYRDAYALYDNKANRGAEAQEGLQQLQKQLEAIGYTISKAKGDYQCSM